MNVPAASRSIVEDALGLLPPPARPYQAHWHVGHWPQQSALMLVRQRPARHPPLRRRSVALVAALLQASLCW